MDPAIWIQKVLDHSTEDYYRNPEMVSALARLVTHSNRQDVILVLQAYSKANK